MFNSKKFIKSFIYKLSNNYLTRTFYNYEISKRSLLPLTSIGELSKEINIFMPYTAELHKPNDWYGHAKILKKFLSLPENYRFKFIIEHGVYLTDQVDEADLETNLPTFMTYCSYRKKVLLSYRKNVFTIGPFIGYAENYLESEIINSEKKRLGKNLTVFPAHSTFQMKMDYDIEKFCIKIQKIAKKFRFKKVRICLYWADVLLGKAEIYKKFGYECITAGHVLDPNFLPRLKSIISISDATISNTAGTHVGYSIFMGVPSVILYEKPGINASKFLKARFEEFLESKPFSEVINGFSKIEFKITSKQKTLVKKYWGTDNIKSKKEFLKLLNQTEKIFNQ